MMKLKTLLLSVAFVSPALAAPDITPSTTTPSGWEAYYLNGSGNCGTIRRHQLGTAVIVNYERGNDTWTFSLSNDKWVKVVSGQKFKVFIRTDQGGRWQGLWEGSTRSGHPMISLLDTKISFL